MNKNSNTYIIGYSAILVIVVALILSFAAISLKEKQAENVKIEKMTDILRSVGEAQGADTAAVKAKYINEEYTKVIKQAYLVNNKGEIVEGDAFSVLIGLKAEYAKADSDRTLPVFVAESKGVTRYILPVWGKGLWGAIWGYVALEKNWNTIYGVVFDHASETPGLGAEITTDAFRGQFANKEIYKDAQMVAISVLKGSGASLGNINAVDAVSGGTLTSRGVQDMLVDCLSGYDAYIKAQTAEKCDAATECETKTEEE
ncbi:MAG: NADH:ubiquinone reductase (Na(+)-transporting) subunit C [Rikenellaceae bacterium]